MSFSSVLLFAWAMKDNEPISSQLYFVLEHMELN